MTLLEYVTTHNIITSEMTLREFFNISLSDTPVTVPPTRKERKEVFELVNDNRGLDATRKIHRNLTGVEIKINKFAVHMEDKVLSRQEADSGYWG